MPILVLLVSAGNLFDGAFSLCVSLIKQDIVKFAVKIIIVPNGLEKHMAFVNKNNLVSIDSM